jgi:hypothetical protein
VHPAPSSEPLGDLPGHKDVAGSVLDGEHPWHLIVFKLRQTAWLNYQIGWQFVDQMLVNISERIDAVAPATRIVFRGQGPVLGLAVPAQVEVDEEALRGLCAPYGLALDHPVSLHGGVESSYTPRRYWRDEHGRLIDGDGENPLPGLTLIDSDDVVGELVGVVYHLDMRRYVIEPGDEKTVRQHALHACIWSQLPSVW